MANFQIALAALNPDEGGFTRDEGGETYRGISRNSWPNWSGWAILDALPPGILTQGVIIRGNAALDQQVAAFYRQSFWLFDALPDQDVANKIFSLFVNLAHAGIRVLQLALQRIEVGPIVADGNWGPQTQAAVIVADPARLLRAIRYFQVKHYLANDANRPNEIDGLLWRAVE